jgi:hypothetical protein
VRERGNTGFSHYNAVQAEIRANGLFNQLTLRTGYTFSKTSDNVSEIFSTFAAGNTVAFPQNPAQPVKGEYSFSGLDYPNSFYTLATWQLPFYRSQHGWAGHIFGGWGFSANYLFQTGQRYTPFQASEVATLTAAGNFYDSAFIGAFVGADTARPFVGNLGAPETAIGAFGGDACAALAVTGSEPVCNPAIAHQLVSVNSLNVNGINSQPVPVTKNQVRFIMNGGAAQTIFGTPFGNMPRNIVQNARTNIANLSVSKNFNIKERASFTFVASCVNVLNHPNFQSIDPTVEDAGNFLAGNGFGNPEVTNTNPGALSFAPLVPYASRKLTFGGVVRF